jgi:hypothetical protein
MRRTLWGLTSGLFILGFTASAVADEKDRYKKRWEDQKKQEERLREYRNKPGSFSSRGQVRIRGSASCGCAANRRVAAALLAAVTLSSR